jgi:hypothetical protein
MSTGARLAGRNVSKALRRAQQDEERLTRFFQQLRTWMPEPPVGWLENANPPGSAPRTGGRPAGKQGA